MVHWTAAGDVAAGSEEVLHYVRDALGSVVGLLDAGEPDATPEPVPPRLVERYDYDPYGKTYIEHWDATAGGGSGAWVRHEPDEPSAFGNTFMWTGQRHDVAIGLYHFPFRTYSPRLGRWLQRDPLGYVDGVNMYEYVSSEPMRLVDALGLQVGLSPTSPSGALSSAVIAKAYNTAVNALLAILVVTTVDDAYSAYFKALRAIADFDGLLPCPETSETAKSLKAAAEELLEQVLARLRDKTVDATPQPRDPDGKDKPKKRDKPDEPRLPYNSCMTICMKIAGYSAGACAEVCRQIKGRTCEGINAACRHMRRHPKECGGHTAVSACEEMYRLLCKRQAP